jgi:hypothetical protein
MTSVEEPKSCEEASPVPVPVEDIDECKHSSYKIPFLALGITMIALMFPFYRTFYLRDTFWQRPMSVGFLILVFAHATLLATQVLSSYLPALRNMPRMTIHIPTVLAVLTRAVVLGIRWTVPFLVLIFLIGIIHRGERLLAIMTGLSLIETASFGAAIHVGLHSLAHWLDLDLSIADSLAAASMLGTACTIFFLFLAILPLQT